MDAPVIDPCVCSHSDLSHGVPDHGPRACHECECPRYLRDSPILRLIRRSRERKKPEQPEAG